MFQELGQIRYCLEIMGMPGWLCFIKDEESGKEYCKKSQCLFLGWEASSGSMRFSSLVGWLVCLLVSIINTLIYLSA